ncbi:hypothetical protein GCM10009616_00660 [Microlunatus lacustris]
MSQQSPEEDRSRLIKAFKGSQMRLPDLWLAYYALGGSAGQYEVEAYLAGLMPLSAHEHNVLAHAINERLSELPPPPRAPYRKPEDEPEHSRLPEPPEPPDSP